jgi:hypothetical protein
MDPSGIQGAITGTVLNAVSVDGRIATSDRAIPLRVSGGADPVQYEGGSLAFLIDPCPPRSRHHLLSCLDCSSLDCYKMY